MTLLTIKNADFNEDNLSFQTPELKIQLLGNLPLGNMERLKVTISLERKGYRKIREQVDLYQDYQVQRLAQRISERLELTQKSGENHLYDLTEHLETLRFKILEKQKDPKQQHQPPSSASLQEAEKLLKSKNLLQQIKTILSQVGIVGEEQNALLLYLVMLSRKRQRPLSAVCLAQSGTGKSHLLQTIANCIYPADKIQSTQMTSSSLFYMGTKLKHKLLLIEDMTGLDPETEYIIRELISNQKCSRDLVGKKSQEGLPETITRTVEGPLSIVTCTTKEEIYEDNSNRSILIHLDNSPAQDERIMTYNNAKAKGTLTTISFKTAQKQLQELDYSLQNISIRNPYAEVITLPELTKTKRRAHQMLHSLIEIITHLHQYQRKEQADQDTGELYIESTAEDILTAYELFQPILEVKSDELNKATRNFYNWLKTQTDEETPFKAQEIRKIGRIDPRTLRRYLKTLTDYGKLKQVGGNKKTGYSYQLQNENELILNLLETHQKAIQKRLGK